MRLLYSLVLAWSLPIYAQEFSPVWQIYQEDFSTIEMAIENNQWQKYSADNVPEGFNKTIWLRNRIPQGIGESSYLYFKNGLEDIEVFIEKDKIYSYGNFDKSWNRVSAQTSHLIPLKEHHAGQDLYIRTHYGISYLVKTLYPVIEQKPQQTLIAMGQKSSIISFMCGNFLIVSLISLIIVAIRRKVDINFYYFCLTLGVFLWVAVNQDSTLKYFFSFNPYLVTRVDVFSLMLGVLGAFGFIHELAPRKTIFTKLPVTLAFGLVGLAIVLGIIPAVSPWYLIPILHFIFAIFGLTGIAVFCYQSAKVIRERIETQMFAAAGLSIGIGGTHDLLRYTPWFSSPIESLIPFGIVLATIFMGAILYLRIRQEQSTYIRQIKDLNHHLEEKVVEKTQDIRSILKSLPQGVFQIVGADAVIGEDYSSSLEVILGQHDISGKNPFEVVFNRTNLSHDKKSQIDTVLRCCLDEEQFMWEANYHLLPTDFHIGDKYIEVDWQEVLDDQDMIHKIVVSLKDVTEIRSLKLEAQKQSDLALVITEIIDIDKDKLAFFLDFATDLLVESIEFLQDKDYKLAFRNLHTIKGNARSYHLTKLVDKSHLAETRLTELLDGDNSQFDDCMTDILKCKDILSLYLQALVKLGVNQSDMIRVSRQDIFEIYQQAREIQSDEEFDLLCNNILFLAEQKLSQIIATDLDALASLAQELGKPVPSIVFQNDNYPIAQANHKLFKKIFTHLLNNSLDHGIETLEGRRAAGKADQGSIFIEIDCVQDCLEIQVYDDGCGLNIDRLEKKAHNLGMPFDKENLSVNEISKLIFSPGFSTTDEVTKISGRGVGLDAVKGFIEESRGSINLEIGDVKNGMVEFKLIIRLPNVTKQSVV